MKIYRLTIFSIAITILLLLSACHTNDNSNYLTETISETTIISISTTPDEITEYEHNDYILNTNTYRFHYPDCYCVELMNESNKEYYTGYREDVILKGFEPCQKCNP